MSRRPAKSCLPAAGNGAEDDVQSGAPQEFQDTDCEGEDRG
jgi:hypothetical protein